MSEFDEQYNGTCAVCGSENLFVREVRSIREGFRCRTCKSTLRYRAQAEAIAIALGVPEATLAELVRTDKVRQMAVYEPGVIGPYRKLFEDHPNYENSFFHPAAPLGSRVKKVRNENLEALTFADNSLDLVISSDILEHVRRPWVAFAEIHRVLKPGGHHIFSIPVQRPMPARSVMRVDTETDEDVHLLEPHYHGDGIGGRSLVYIDYGLDITERLTELGYIVSMLSPTDPDALARRAITFITTKQVLTADAGAPTSPSDTCNICGSTEFVAGPLGRLTTDGKPPTCSSCGSLERHRGIRYVWDLLPRELLGSHSALQFSRDPSVDPAWFGSHEFSVYGTETSIDVQDIDRDDGAYDIVICNHVLEHVERDTDAFAELMRIVAPDGFLQMSVPNPILRKVTEDWGYPKTEFHGHYRHYGIDLIERFRSVAPADVLLSYVEVEDPVTGAPDLVFFWTRSAATNDSFRRAFEAPGVELR